MKVNIIGAGISGLYAGFLLSKENIDFEIFEATERSGGRIFSYLYDDDHFIELGAEVVYAPESLLVKTLNMLKDPIYTSSGDNLYHYKKSILSGKNLGDHLMVKKLMQDLYEIEDYDGIEKSLLDYFKQQNYYKSNMKNLVEAFACEYGTTADKLGIQNLAFEESLWSGGDDEYYSKLPLQRVSEYYKDKIADNIQYKKIIKTVKYSDNIVTLIDDQGKEHVSDKTIISVNIGVLKAGDIYFDPVLPTEKQESINAIGIEAGMKVVLTFSSRWWPDDLKTIEGGVLCHEFLATKNYDIPTLTGFVMGRNTMAFRGLSDSKIAEILLCELDDMFGHQKATESFSQVFLKNWGEDTFQKGAYSFPTIHSKGMREVLAKPVGNKLFFMGEACSVNGHAASIHGAMESAEIVCENIINQFVAVE